MANAIYPKYKQAVISGGIDHDLNLGNVKVMIIDAADYTYSTSHEFLSDVAVSARVATSSNLTGKTFTDGTFDTDDVTLSAVTGDQSEALILYVDTLVEATSRLVCYRDTGITGLPVTLSGGDITISVPSGWFTL